MATKLIPAILLACVLATLTYASDPFIVAVKAPAIAPPPARNFDGTNDNISFGSDASIDDFTGITASAWIVNTNTSGGSFVIGKDREAGGWGLVVLGADSSSRRLEFGQDFDSANGFWTSPNPSITVGAPTHIVVVYDRSSAANDPIIYINGVSVTVTEATAPVGNSVGDATVNLLIGENGAGAQDYTGQIGFVNYANALWTAGQVNRARWWGTPGGSIAAYHPLITDKLANQGTATANGSATGTTVSGIPRVERCWASMMGIGR